MSSPDSVKKPRIAAIVPLYNGAPFIAEALQSIRDQTRPAEEIIVVDDGSTDGGRGAAVVRDFAAAHRDLPVRLLAKPNGGQGSARNFGVGHSSAELIAFLDQDDAWYPHHLAVLEEPFLKAQALPLGYVYSNLDEVNAAGEMIRHSVLDQLSTREHPKRTLGGCLSEDMMILPGASLIARKAFDDVGGFNPTLSGYEDDDLFLRLFLKGYRSIYTNQPLTRWRIHSDSTSFGLRMAHSRMRYFQILLAKFPDEPVLNRYYARNLLIPRFTRNIAGDIERGLIERNFERIALGSAHLHQIAQALKGPRRYLFNVMAWIIAIRPIARAAMNMPRHVRAGIARRLLGLR